MRIDSHAESQIHTEHVIYEQWKRKWKRNGRIDANMERDARNAANYWRQVHIINVTITLATCNLSFRGHREIIGQSNSWNFLSIIQLLARFDPVLKELLERPQGSFKYLSPSNQNEIIYIIAKRVQCDIQEEINSAPFFSVIMDTTQDISKRDQLSQVYRYVTI